MTEKPLLTIAEYEELAALGNPNVPADARIDAWLKLGNRVWLHMDWDGKSYSAFDSLPPGQTAVYFTSELYGYARGEDFLGFLGISKDTPERCMTTLELLQAEEYLRLLTEVKNAMPDRVFPEFAEDWMPIIMKFDLSWFEEIGRRIALAEGMQRPLVDYVFDYILTHPQDFCHAPSEEIQLK